MPEANQSTEQTDSTTAAIAAAAKVSSSGDKSLTAPTPTPQDEDQSTPTETGEEDEGQNLEEGADGASPGVAAAQQGADKQQKAPWFQKRIDQLTWEKNEERRTSAALLAEKQGLLAEIDKMRNGAIAGQAAAAGAADPNAGSAASTAATPQAPAKPQVNMSEAEIEARSIIKAQQLAAKASFDKSCNTIAMQGKEQYQDFDSALKTYEMLGGIPQAMLDAVIEIPNGHRVLYAIGKDPELADRIVKMSPARMGMELAKMDNAINKVAAKPISRVGTPITPIETTTSGNEPDPEKMSTSEWLKWREKTKKTKW